MWRVMVKSQCRRCEQSWCNISGVKSPGCSVEAWSHGTENFIKHLSLFHYSEKQVKFVSAYHDDTKPVYLSLDTRVFQHNTDRNVSWVSIFQCCLWTLTSWFQLPSSDKIFLYWKHAEWAFYIQFFPHRCSLLKICINYKKKRTYSVCRYVF